MNALFYNDKTMHNIYINEVSFDIEYKLPQILYSSFISMGLNMLLKKLALSNDEITYFKNNKKIDDNKEKGRKLISKLNIKFIIYYIISFMLLLFF